MCNLGSAKGKTDYAGEGAKFKVLLKGPIHFCSWNSPHLISGAC